MPIYKIKAPDGQIIRIRGDSPPTQEIVEEAYAKLTKQSSSPQESPQERMMSIARTVLESAAPVVGALRDKDIKEEARNIATIASYAPTPTGLATKAAIKAASMAPKGLAAKLAGSAGKFLAQTVPQAGAGAGVTYIGQREKGVLPEQAEKDAAKGLLFELGAQGVLSGVGKLATTGMGKLGESIPNDLFKKAKMYSKETAEPVEKRIEQIQDLGTKALKNNKKIETRIEGIANKAEVLNKKIINQTAAQLKKANRLFHDKNRDKTKLITNIKQRDISDFIRQEEARLQQNASTLIESGIRTKTRPSEEQALEAFRGKFMTSYVRKDGVITYEPVKLRSEIFKELGNIQKAAEQGFKEGAAEMPSLYKDIYKNFSEFFKLKSPKYRDHMELGQDLVRMHGAKVNIPITKDGEVISQLYNPKKLKNSFDQAIEEFDKLADQDKVFEIERLVDSSNKLFKTDFKVDTLLAKYQKNQRRIGFKGAKTGLTETQINQLPKKLGKRYKDNKDLTKVNEKGFFTDPEKVKSFIKNEKDQTRLAKLLPKELLKQIDIEEAGRTLRRFGGIENTPLGVIGSPLIRAINVAKNIGRVPQARYQARRFVESDIPEQLGKGVQALTRLTARDMVRDDKQKTDVVQDPQTGEYKVLPRNPWATQRTSSGNISPESLNKLRRIRGIGGIN
tara:strand:+ start:1006 stop:3036 length:2031 start_codon:yes stop_codon:yes gene_type:complete